MTFKISNEQSARRHALAADLRVKAQALNTVIAAFNRGLEPLTLAVDQALNSYNETLRSARQLAGDIAEAAHDKFDARSEKWQDSDKGIQVRDWIEQWEMSLDEVDLQLPDPLEELDPEEHAREIAAAPRSPADPEPIAQDA